MTFTQAIVFGIIQGITEFLPVSSSGHLVLTTYFWGWDIPSEQAFIFDVLVQVGTLIAVIVYFRTDFITISRGFLLGQQKKNTNPSNSANKGWLLIIGTIPAATFGWVLKNKIESAFESPLATALFLLVSAILLIIAERIGKRYRDIDDLLWFDALVIGFFQLLALFPGVSRSGSTITGGMAVNLDRESAARFSFLMAVPIMLIAGAISLIDLFLSPGLLKFVPQILVGTLTSGIVGYFTIHWLLSFLSKSPLYIFAFYVTILSFSTLLSLLIQT